MYLIGNKKNNIDKRSERPPVIKSGGSDGGVNFRSNRGAYRIQ